MKIKIYSGICLQKKDVNRILPGAEFSSPIGRGSITKDIERGYQVIGIVDGVFYNELAVCPSEIMDALRAGIMVFGSSSMGALRAAELQKYGMIGVGKIFEFILNSETFEDDWLGQLFFQKHPTYHTESFIDLLMALRYFLAQKMIFQTQYNRIIRLCRHRHFTERSSQEIVEMLNSNASSLGLPSIFFKKILQFPSTKRSDSISLLNEIARHHKTVQSFNKQKITRLR